MLANKFGVLRETGKVYGELFQEAEESIFHIPTLTIKVGQNIQTFFTEATMFYNHHSVGTKGVSQNHLLSFDDNKVLKLSIGYAKHLFKCTGF